MPGCIHPKSMTEQIAEFRVHPQEMLAEHVLPFVPKATEVDQKSDPRLSMVMRILAECTTVHATATDLIGARGMGLCCDLLRRDRPFLPWLHEVSRSQARSH